MDVSGDNLRYSFTKPKFMHFSKEQQHKKCASILRHLYDLLLSRQPNDKSHRHYNELQEWMNLPALEALSMESVSDRYHFHLRLANRQLKEHNLLPRVTTNDRKDSEPLWPIAIYLDNLRSAHNVGSILRTVEALSLGRVYASPSTPFVDHKQVQDVSMGTSTQIKGQKIENWKDLPQPLIVLETSPDATSIHDFIFPETFTLVIGNEEYGVSDRLLQLADALITLPLRGRKNSLNVANAFSMAAHEISRQRQVNNHA